MGECVKPCASSEKDGFSTLGAVKLQALYVLNKRKAKKSYGY